MSPATRKLAVALILATGLGATIGAAPARAQQDARARKVDEIFARWDRPGSPGAAVVVLENGEVVHQKGYGYANLDYDIPITPSTIFDIASVSKQFTAFAVLMLADQGRLSLDDDVRKYIPELPDFGQKVTLRHLLHHTSGIRDWVELLSISGYRFDDVIAPHDIMTFARHQEGLNFTPGAEFLYSNTGYNLLAETVARVSGQPFATFMEEHVFRPLGMTSTHILTDHQRIVPNRATSYAPNEKVDELSNLHASPPPADGSWRIWVDNTSAPGSSSVMTNVQDMAKWMRNFETARVGGKRVIQQMLERGRLNDGQEIAYACGLQIGEYRGLKTVSHSGGWRGFRTELLWFPDQHLAVTVLGNSTSFSSGRTAAQVAEVYLGDQLGPVAARPERGARTRTTEQDKGAPIDGARLDEYAGTYTSRELGTTYRVVVDDGRVAVRHRKMPEQILTAAGSDRFVTPGIRGELTFTFVRDGRGTVTGYELAGARFRHVLFARETH